MIPVLMSLVLAAVGEGMISPSGVATIIGALSVFAGGIMMGRGTKRVEIGGNSEIALKERFITREEAKERFDRIENKMALDLTEVKGLFRETMGAISQQNTTLTKKIESQNLRLSESINKSADDGRDGRVAIWNVVNPLRERISAHEVNSNVADAVTKLADALNAPTTKIQPVHQSPAH